MPATSFSAVRVAAGALADLAFPPRCVACGCATADEAPDSRDWCPDCLNDLQVFEDAGCPRCAAPLVGDSTACSVCRDESWAFDRAVALGPYDGLLRHLLLLGKQPGGERGVRAVARMIAERRTAELSEFNGARTLITPVSSHWTRRFARRANSPDWIAEELAWSTGLPLGRVLFRTRATRAQTDIAPSQRESNVRGSFAARSRVRLHGVTVLLVDDVLTTGATASAAARTLKRAGAERVVAVVAAKRLARA